MCIAPIGIHRTIVTETQTSYLRHEWNNMPGNKQSRNHLIYVAKILHEETDAQAGLSLPQLQQRLEDHGITVERKSLYRDFDVLESIGMKIGKIAKRPVQYYLGTRLFTPSQMMLLVDAVQTSRSITEQNSIELISRLKKLTSAAEASQLESRVHVSGRIKMQNESVFLTLDKIQQAIAEHRMISFRYQQYDVNMKQRYVKAQDGNERIRTPLFLVYSDENYYMLAYDENGVDHLRSYRVDRMRSVMLLEESPAHHKPDPSFRITDHERHTLGMYNITPVRIKLHVAEERIGNIIDIFGTEDVSIQEARGVVELESEEGTEGKGEGRRWANVRITTAPSPVFFGKIATFGGDVRIVSPKKVVAAYQAHLERSLAAQQL